MELFKASRQWATRPDDERFWNLEEMFGVCKDYAGKAAEGTAPYRSLMAHELNGEVAISGPNGTKALTTHYAFGQLAARVQAPASYLRRLPISLAVDCLNEGFGNVQDDKTAALLFHRNNGDLVLRCAVSEQYERVWNWEVVQRLLGLSGQGWRTAPARPGPTSGRTRIATADDCGPWTMIQPGNTIGPAGLYASDHDMFAFLMNPDRAIDDGTGHPLYRGFFCWNSEVGDTSWGIETFLYEMTCGNHIVWNAKDVKAFRFRHVGKIDEKIARTVSVELTKYSDQSANDEEGRIVKARTFVLAKTKDETLDMVFAMRIPALSRGILTKSYDRAQVNGYDPNTAWGLVQGITRVSQDTAYADDRTMLDRAAGKVMAIAF